MLIRCHAKINLVLDVLKGKRSDNFHELDSIMLLTSLFDELEMKVNNSNCINIATSGIDIRSEDNLIYKCLNLLKKEYNLSEGFDIILNKKIPLESGLGGGSSDAASALLGANKLLNLGLSLDELAKIGAQIGSDIPFFVFNQHSRIKGRGEVVIPIKEINFNPHVLLVKPSFGVSTKEAYQTLNINEVKHCDVDKVLKALVDGDYSLVCSLLFNALEQSSFKLNNKLKEIKDELLAFGFDGALMCGSGSTLFALTNNEFLAFKGMEYFKEKYGFAQVVHILKGV